MDLATLLADRPLVQQLAAEYDALKRSGAHVDHAAWVEARLRDAAAGVLAVPGGGPPTAAPRQSSGGQQPDGDGDGALAAIQRRQAAACARQRLAYRAALRRQRGYAAAAAALAAATDAEQWPAGIGVAANGWQVWGAAIHHESRGACGGEAPSGHSRLPSAACTCSLAASLFHRRRRPYIRRPPM